MNSSVKCLPLILAVIISSGQLIHFSSDFISFGDFSLLIDIDYKLKHLVADGLLFTPKALVKDVTGIMDLFIFTVSCVFISWMPEKVEPSSKQQAILLLRCIRPLRIFSLVPHMRKVVYELCRGFKEIALVSVLLIVLLFTFACYGVHMFGGRLARCNDPDINTPVNLAPQI